MHSADTPLFELRSSPIQGTGAFATTTIPKGTRIIEYVGEKISNREADRRYDDETMNRHHTFLFTLNDRYVVDAAVGGNESRFINHSCAPNCEAVIERGHIYIEALENIPPGTELAYDYAYERADDHTQDDEALYVCRCGASTCRGTILAPPKRKRRRKRPAAKKKGSSRRTRQRQVTRSGPKQSKLQSGRTRTRAKGTKQSRSTRTNKTGTRQSRSTRTKATGTKQSRTRTTKTRRSKMKQSKRRATR